MLLLYAASTLTVAITALVVAARLVMYARQCSARGWRLAMLLSGSATLLGLGATGAVDVMESIQLSPGHPILRSAWLWTATGGVMVLWFEIFGHYAVEKSKLELRLKELATTDPLTGILNRRAFMERAEALTESARRYGHPLAALMIDIDHFKTFNDRFGHEAGDAVLRAVTEAVAGCLRKVDVFGRLGGEEFAVLMPETDAAGAAAVAERIRSAVETETVTWHGTRLTATVSIGVAQRREGIDGLLHEADSALYGAKDAGRNRVAVEG